MCLIFPLRRAADGVAQVLLGVKLRGFGQGRVVGVGGHVEPGESGRQAACRELAEETGLLADPAQLRDAGRVRFRFPAQPEADLDAELFTVRDVGGTAERTEEVDPFWVPVEQVPAGRMWDDSRIWLPHVLRGERVEVFVTYDDAGRSVAQAHLRVGPSRT